MGRIVLGIVACVTLPVWAIPYVFWLVGQEVIDTVDRQRAIMASKPARRGVSMSEERPTYDWLLDFYHEYIGGHTRRKAAARAEVVGEIVEYLEGDQDGIPANQVSMPLHLVAAEIRRKWAPKDESEGG